jgi:bacterioferritin (cytochrome b1)
MPSRCASAALPIVEHPRQMMETILAREEEHTNDMHELLVVQHGDPV